MTARNPLGVVAKFEGQAKPPEELIETVPLKVERITWEDGAMIVESKGQTWRYEIDDRSEV